MLELDVKGAGDPARFPLVGLAHVDELSLVLLEQLRHLLRRQVALGLLENVHVDVQPIAAVKAAAWSRCVSVQKGDVAPRVLARRRLDRLPRPAEMQ